MYIELTDLKLVHVTRRGYPGNQFRDPSRAPKVKSRGSQQHAFQLPNGSGIHGIVDDERYVCLLAFLLVLPP
jgi:hypothetical protein